MENPQSSYQFKIHTFGCKVNTYDTGLLQKRLLATGRAQLNEALVASTDKRPAVHILNSCAVTAEATKDAIKEARRLKAKDPLATVVMTGCAAQVDGTLMDHLPGIDLVVANSHKGQLESILDRYFRGQLTEKVFRSNIFRKDDLEAGGGQEQGHTRAFLKIQDGCNSFCTYCVIPFARGKSRSLSVKDLITRINELTVKGAREVVLTGVHIGDYEDRSADARIRTGGEPALLHDLVAAVLKNTSAERIRLSSLEPIELTAELVKLYKNNSRLCRHFHMSIQSANTRVLAGMKRNYSSDHVEQTLEMIARDLPGSFVGMDVIAGFTGETDEEFEDTYLRLARLPWTRLHVFPFSERPGTKAAAMEDPVPRDRRALRAQRLRELSSERFREQAKAQLGTEKTVLLLKDGTSSLSRDYWPVRLQADHALERLVGNEVRVRITSFDQSQASRMDGILNGELIV